MPRETATEKAGRLLVSGRIVIDRVADGEVHATARGEGKVHEIELRHGMWSCTCEHRGPGCSHLIAVRRVVAVVE